MSRIRCGSTAAIVKTFLILVAMSLVLFWWTLERRRAQKLVERAKAIHAESLGKTIELHSVASGVSLGTVDSQTFRELLLLYAKNTGDVSSFYILKDALDMLRPADGLRAETNQFMRALVGDRDHIDVAWGFFDADRKL